MYNEFAPTADTLFLLVLSILTLESVHSIRFLYQHFLSGITTKSLNTFYHACSYAKVDYSHFMNITAKVALRMIPDSLATQPIFLCVDDTMVAKAGTRSGGILKQATMSRKPSGHFAGIWYEAARVLKCW